MSEKNVAMYSRLVFYCYIYLISIPIHLNWVTNSCFKNIEIGRDIKSSAYTLVVDNFKAARTTTLRRTRSRTSQGVV